MKRVERPNWASLLVAASFAAGLTAPAAATADDSRLQWVRQLGSDQEDRAKGVATDAAGNVYVAGETDGDLGGPNQGFTDAWLAKVDAANQVIWKRQLGSNTYDGVGGVATSADGSVYVAGLTYGALAGPNQGGRDTWIARYDAAGQRAWKRQLGSSGNDDANGVATDTIGNVYLAGQTSGALAGPNQGGDDAWVAKYDATGRRVWKRQLGSSNNDGALAVATDIANNVYVSGYTYGALAGANQGGLDAWVAKYDAEGRRIWMRQLGSVSDDHASGVATGVDAAGNVEVYLTGDTYGDLGGPNQGSFDVWMARYDAGGRRIWERHLGTDVEDYAYGVTTDAAGNAYLTGYTKGALVGPKQGSVDAWVAKYDAGGHRLWSEQLGAPVVAAYAVATASYGNVADVYIAGETPSALCGDSRGGADAFIAKFSPRP
jgi:Beta-propeller repeat.